MQFLSAFKPPFRRRKMLPFGYVYDERMLEHVCNYDKTMAENPDRMKLIYERLQSDGLLEDAVQIRAREATDSEITLNHPQKLIRQIVALTTDEACEEFCRGHQILWMNPNSLMAARIAAGASIDMVKAHKEGRIGNGFAMVRPPGHHSWGENSMGYCVFNNVAIAAKYAVNHLGYKKVSIVDFDYHAANGTYYSVKDDPRIHLTSFHSYHRGLFWPFSKDFDYATPDHSLFIPLNCAMNSEGDYIGAFNHLVLPVLKEWEPELILVSAGFDAGYYDLMGDQGQGIKAHGYGHIVKMLNEVAPNKVLAFLEGGYFHHNYVESAAMMTRGLKGLHTPLVDIPNRINGSMAEVIWNNIVHHKKRWSSLNIQLEKLQNQQKSLGLDPFTPGSQIYLGAQVKKLWDEVVLSKACRTREWFPQLPADVVQQCIDKIDEVKKAYKYSSNISKPSEEELLKQLTWDIEAQTEALVKPAPSLKIWMDDYLTFMHHKKDHMMVCDWQLIREKNVKF